MNELQIADSDVHQGEQDGVGMRMNKKRGPKCFEQKIPKNCCKLAPALLLGFFNRRKQHDTANSLKL